MVKGTPSQSYCRRASPNPASQGLYALLGRAAVIRDEKGYAKKEILWPDRGNQRKTNIAITFPSGAIWRMACNAGIIKHDADAATWGPPMGRPTIRDPGRLRGAPIRRLWGPTRRLFID